MWHSDCPNQVLSGQYPGEVWLMCQRVSHQMFTLMFNRLNFITNSFSNVATLCNMNNINTKWKEKLVNWSMKLFLFFCDETRDYSVRIHARVFCIYAGLPVYLS